MGDDANNTPSTSEMITVPDFIKSMVWNSLLEIAQIYQELPKAFDEAIKEFLEAQNEYRANNNFIVSQNEKIEARNEIHSQLRKRHQEVLRTEELENLYQSASDSYPIIDPNHVGFCLIINQQNFIPPLEERIGTEEDCFRLECLLRFLKLDFKIIENIKSTMIIDAIESTIEKYFKPNHSIFMLVILSHGVKGRIFGIDSKTVEIAEIEQCLLLPELKAKPKVVIIQACQGENSLPGLKSDIDGTYCRKIQPHPLPEDTLLCMSSIPHFVPIPDTQRGTWYIQTLCEIIHNYPELEVTTILKKVQFEFSYGPDIGIKKNQRTMPENYNRLKKDLFFKRPNLEN